MTNKQGKVTISVLANMRTKLNETKDRYIRCNMFELECHEVHFTVSINMQKSEILKNCFQKVLNTDTDIDSEWL
jgi:hypothetical protein